SVRTVPGADGRNARPGAHGRGRSRISRRNAGFPDEPRADADGLLRGNRHRARSRRRSFRAFLPARIGIGGVLTMNGTSHLTDVPLRDRPLIVCDIDEVVLEFLNPFTAFLRANSHDLLPRSFRLHGNIVSLIDGRTADDAAIAEFLERFFLSQDSWQT